MLKRKLLLTVSMSFDIFAAALNVSAANNRTRLEPCYMANVALYMPDKTLAKLIQVSKRGREGVMCLRRISADTKLQNSEVGNIETLDFDSSCSRFGNMAFGANDIDPKKIKVISFSNKHGAYAVTADALGGGFGHVSEHRTGGSAWR